MPQPSRFIIRVVICGWLALFFFPQPQIGALNDEVGGEKIVLITNKSGATRAYRRGHRLFKAKREERDVVEDADGNLWEARESALEQTSAHAALF